MTNYSFNLIDRPWIWAVWLEGSRRELISLYTSLTCANQIREIHGDTPPETAALHRLLLTVLYRIYSPDDEWADRWGEIWRNGNFDTGQINEYLRREDIYSHFDLFDSRHPFFQTVSNWPNDRTQTVSDLLPHYASGNDAVLFDHRTKHSGLGLNENEKEGGTILHSAEAARALIAQQAFGLGGTKGSGISFSNAPCARGVVFLLGGDTLFETLMLNFFPLDLERDYGLPHKNNDSPAWEMDDPFRDDPQRPYGYLDYATWQNRKVLLIPDGGPNDPIVRRMRYYVGMKRMTGNPMNPMMALHLNPDNKYKKKTNAESSTHLPIQFLKNRALWRDSAPLFGWQESSSHGGGQKDFIHPYAFSWIHSELPAVIGSVADGREFFFSAYGICTESGKDKMFFFRAERFPLPLEYLKEIGAEAAKQLRLALQLAEQIARILSVYGPLGYFAREVLGISRADKNKGENKARITNLLHAAGAERYFWSRLEPLFFQLVEDLPRDIETAVTAWNDALKQLAWQGFQQVVRVVGETRALRAYGLAANEFDQQLQDVFNPPINHNLPMRRRDQ